MSKLSSPLNAAAKIAIVERILASSYFAMTSRRESAAKDDIAAVELLLAANAKGKDGIAACRSVDVNAKDEYGNTALMKAARRGNTAIVELLLAVPGIDVNAKDQFDGTTALIKAAMGKGNIAVVELLLAAGADVNAKDEYGNTALITAAGNGDIAVVELLLAAPGIDVNAKGKDGSTALMQAAYWGHTAIVELLLAAGANVNVAAGADCEHTPYCMCYFCCFCDGDDHPSLFWYGETALIGAAGSGDTAVVELLLAAPGIDVNAKDDVGQTALIAAAERGNNIAVVELLLAAPGIDVNAKDEYGNTALMKAAMRGNIAVVRAIERFIAGQAMNMWIPRHRARQRDRVGLSELDREGTPFMDVAYYTTQGFL